MHSYKHQNSVHCTIKNLANKNTSSLECYYLQLTIKHTVYETRPVYMTYSNKQRHQNIKVNSTSTMWPIKLSEWVNKMTHLADDLNAYPLITTTLFVLISCVVYLFIPILTANQYHCKVLLKVLSGN